MDLHFSPLLLQLAVLAFIGIFAFVSVKKPSLVLRLFPIILPFYLIKLYLNLQLISEAIKSHSFSLFINSFFNPLYKEYPVLPPDFGEAKTTAIPTNLLEITLIIFLITNIGLVFRGIKILKKTSLGKYFLATCYFLLFTIVLSTLFGLNQKVSLGIAKSWFFLPILLFFTLLPYLSIPRFREKYLNSIALGGVVIVALNLPFLLFYVLTYDHRLSGIYLSPNHLGMAIVPGFLVLVVWLLAERKVASGEEIGNNGKWKNQNGKWWCRPWRRLIDCREATLKFFILIFAFLIIYKTTSYSTWLGLIGALFFLLFFLKTNVAQFHGAWNMKHETSEVKHIASKKCSSLHALCFMLHALRFMLYALCFIALLFISQLGNPKLQSILHGDYYSSFHSRQMIWQSAIEISRDHFFLGVGPGNFQKAYLDYASKRNEPYIEWAAPEPHNLFLALWTQVGFLGLLSFVLVIYLSLAKLFSKNQKCKNQNGKLWCRLWRPSIDCREATPQFSIFHFLRQRRIRLWRTFSISSLDPLSLWAILYLLYFLLHGLTDTPYFKNDLSILFWLSIAAFWSKRPK